MSNYSDAIFPSASFSDKCCVRNIKSFPFTDDFHVSLFFAQLLVGRAQIRIQSLNSWGNGYEENDTNTVYGVLRAGTTKTVLIDWSVTEERLRVFDFPVVYDYVSLGIVTAKESRNGASVRNLLNGIFAPLAAPNWILGAILWVALQSLAFKFPKLQARTVLMMFLMRFLLGELYKSHLAAVFIHPKPSSLSFHSFHQLSDVISRGEKRIVLRHSNSSHISHILRNGKGTEWETLSEQLKTHPPIYIPVTIKEICKFLVRNPSYILVDRVDDIRQKCRTECLAIPRWAQNQLPTSFLGFVMPKNHSLREFAAQNAEAVIGYRATFLAFRKNLQECTVPEQTNSLQKYHLVLGGLIFASILYAFAVFVFVVERLAKTFMLS